MPSTGGSEFTSFVTSFPNTLYATGNFSASCTAAMMSSFFTASISRAHCSGGLCRLNDKNCCPISSQYTDRCSRFMNTMLFSWFFARMNSSSSAGSAARRRT